MPEIIYHFMGRDIPITLSTPETYKISRTIHKPLSPDRIVGIDTESIKRNGDLRFKYLQLYANEHTLLHDQEQTSEDILEVLFSWLLERYGETFQYPSDIAERSKETRTRRNNGKKSGRDGRKQYLTPVLLAFFNLQYDLGRLIDSNVLFRRIIGYGSDSFKFKFKKYDVEIVYSCLGVACPSFRWIVVDNEKRVGVSIVGFDGTSFFKSTLAEVTRQLGLTAKIDLEEDKDLFSRDWSINPPTSEQLARFEQYSLNDAKCHKEIYDVLAQLLSRIDVQIFDKAGVIPLSAPAAAARVMMHLCEKEEFKAPPIEVQQIGLNSYRGAISFCTQPGYHSNIIVKDISSAYPHVMTLLPDFSKVVYKLLAPVSGAKLDKQIKEWSLQYKELNPIFGTVIADFEALDALYPIAVTYADNKQLGIYGRCVRTAITIPELIIAYNSGRCTITRIYSGYVMVGTNENSPLKLFVEKCYALKVKAKAENDEPMYLLAKLLMNSLYGKLVEKRHTTHIIQSLNHDHLLEVPDIQEKPYIKHVLKTYLEYGADKACEEAERIAHETYHDNFKRYILLSELLNDEKWSTGYYFNAIYAAQITGFTRAKLMCASYFTNAVAGDTDSIFLPCEEYGPHKHEFLTDYLNSIGAITPPCGLGSFETELEGASGLILKKKQYYLEGIVKEKMTNGSIKIKNKLKEAHHAIQSVSGKQYEKEGIKTNEAVKLQIKEYLKELYENGSLEYETREKPVSLKAGLQGVFEYDDEHDKRIRQIKLGEFIKKKIRLEYHKKSEFQDMRKGIISWKKSLIVNNKLKELI